MWRPIASIQSAFSGRRAAAAQGLAKAAGCKHARPILTQLEDSLQVNLNPHVLSQELYLATAQMQEMVQGGMELGAHTIHHPSLLHVDLATARKEIFESGDFVKRVAKTDTVAFAYPFGEGSNAPSIRRLVHDYGYYAACTSIAGLNCAEANPLELERLESVGDSLYSSYGILPGARWLLCVALCRIPPGNQGAAKCRTVTPSFCGSAGTGRVVGWGRARPHASNSLFAPSKRCQAPTPLYTAVSFQESHSGPPACHFYDAAPLQRAEKPEPRPTRFSERGISGGVCPRPRDSSSPLAMGESECVHRAQRSGACRNTL